MSICNECEFFHETEGVHGNCKMRNIERHVVPSESHSKEIVNGWPEVDGTVEACGKFEIG